MASSARARQIVDVALELLETEGPEGVSMRRIGERLGIRAPSLYKHVRDKDALETAMIAVGFEETAELFERAVRRPDPLRALARAYRDFARRRPHLYRLMHDRPLRRDLLPPGLEERAARPLLEIAGDRASARALWGLAHGLTILELNGRFPPGADVGAAWRRGLAAFVGHNDGR
jgi:AcrR family transcriptional regulator